MNAIGIDISKGKSIVSVLRPLGEVVHSPFEVIHTDSGIKQLIQKLSKCEGDTKNIMEHTGRYHESLATELVAVGNNTLRKVKSDKAYSIKITRYGLDNWADLSPYTES